jgi:hypothetical protein
MHDREHVVVRERDLHGRSKADPDAAVNAGAGRNPFLDSASGGIGR